MKINFLTTSRRKTCKKIATKSVVILMIFIQLLFSGWPILDETKWEKYFSGPSKAQASTTITIDSQSDWMDGIYDENLLDTQASGGLSLKYDNGGLWEDLAIPSFSPAAGANAVYINGANALFMVSGGRLFWKYDISLNHWSSLPDTPYDIGSGAKLQYDGENTIYLLRGGNTTSIYTYDISNQVWSTLTDAPENINRGSMALDPQDNIIYVAKGNSETKFWSYSIEDDAWAVKTPIPSSDASTGVDLTYLNGKIYYQAGGYSYGVVNRPIYEFNPSSGGWVTKASSNRRDFSQSGTITDGSLLYVIEGGSSQNFRKFDPGSNTWTSLSLALATFSSSGGTIVTDGTSIYAFRGSSQVFSRYIINSDSWDSLASPPAKDVGQGLDLTYLNGKIYFQGRGYSWSAASFPLYEYDLVTNSWATKASSLRKDLSQSGSTSDGNFLYSIDGNGLATFRRYDPNTDTWAPLLDAPSAFSTSGATITASSSHVYAIQGNSVNWWKYNIANPGWEALPELPIAATTGASISYAANDNAVFYIRGNRAFWKYDFDSLEWTALSDVPYDVGSGSKLEYDGDDYLYLLRGGGTSSIYRYQISTGLWTTIASLPLTTNLGGMIYEPGSDQLFVAKGGTSDLFWKNSTLGRDLPTSATHVKELDLTYVSSWTSLIADVVNPDDSTVEIETRVSTDGTFWSSWNQVVGTEIASTTGSRYLQVKTTLNASSDESISPVVNSLSLTYDSDLTAPANPTSIQAFADSSQEVLLAEGESHSETNPFFLWSGASDNQAGLKGYYVYFGPNNNAVPQSDGYFQTSTSYEVRESLTFGNTYYLYVQAVDNADNLATVPTPYSYIYNGISPSTTLTFSSQEEFAQASSTTNIDIDSNIDSFEISGNNLGKWFGLSVLPTADRNTGIDLTALNGKIYYQNFGYSYGSISGILYEFDPVDNTWNSRAPSSRRYLHQSGTTTDGTNLYQIEGDGLNIFRSYDPLTNQWTSLPAAPSTFSVSGATLVSDGIDIYAFQGNSSLFWRFNTSEQEWDQTRATTPSSVTAGASAVYVESEDSFFVTGGSRNFWKYNITTNTWSSLIDTPYAVGTGSKLEYDGGNYVYLLRGGGTDDVFIYNLTTSTWTVSDQLPTTSDHGSIAYDSTTRRLYVARGGSTTSLYQYEVILSDWVQYMEAPATTMNPVMLFDDLDSIYVLRGSSSRTFWRYSVSSGIWTTLTDAPGSISYGADLSYDGSRYIYALRGNGTANFYRYDIQDNDWEILTSTPAIVNQGGGLEYVASKNKIYALRGDNTQDFWEYDLVEQTWISKANVNTAIRDGPGLVSGGNGYLYAARGYNSSQFVKYSLEDDGWTNAASALVNLQSCGTAMVSDNSDIYIFPSNSTRSFLKYSINGNTWTQLPDIPFVPSYGSMTKVGDRIFALSGSNQNTFSYFSLNTNKEYKGEFVSQVMSLGNTYRWAGISATMETDETRKVVFESRSSLDNDTWSDWQTLTNEKQNGNNYTYNISSGIAQFFQFKASLFSLDNISSPIVEEISLSYYKDEIDPSNPDEVSAYTNSLKTIEITNNNWSNQEAPYFEWEPASDGDGGSGVAGYYVYFGVEEDIAPSDDSTLQTETSFIANNLIDGETYYLRIQTKDNANNYSEPNTLFTYKFDSAIPNPPTSVSTTDVGYKATNEYTFYWPDAIDVGGSGIAGYEYKTGSTDIDDPYSRWQFTSSTTATGVTAYQEGPNYFFVRSLDNAGNYSATTSNLGVAAFYFNQTAPTRPQNVVINPQTTSDNPSADNVFAVNWDLPDSYSGEIIKYYYCVNCTPSITSMTQTNPGETANRSLSNLALATQQGKNTFYLVAEDNNINVDTGRGNANFDAYSAVDFYAQTIAPGAPRNLKISDTSDRDEEIWRLTLTWREPDQGGTPNRYDVYRSADEEKTYTKIGNVSSGAYTDTELEYEKSYYYKVRAVDNAGSESIFSNVVSESPVGRYTDPPSAGGIPSVAVGSTTATVSWQTSRSAFGTVEYGRTSGYGSAASSVLQTAAHSVKITGLSPGTDYHFRVHSLDDSSLVGYDRAMAYSGDFTFTTLNQADIANVQVSDISLESGVISWDTASLSSSQIDYGLSSEYGQTVIVSTTADEATHTARLTNLDHSTQYHFRIKGITVDETEIFSEDYTFNTLTFPTVTAMVMNTDQAAAGATLVLAWATNVPTTGTVQYQPVDIDLGALRGTNLGSRLLSTNTAGEGLDVGELQSLSQDELALLPAIPTGEVETIYQGELSKRHIQRISGLKDGAMYVITVRGTDEYGNEAIGDPIRYVTGADTRSPEIQNLIMETPISGTGAEASASIIISWETDEPAYGQIHWGIGAGAEFPNSTEKTSEPTMKHVLILRDLQPTQSYHLKVNATDIAGNITTTDDMVVVTPTAQQAAFDIVLKNLEDIFGFLK